MWNLKKITVVLLASLLLFFTVEVETSNAAVNTKKSRVTYTLKDSSGKKYKLYVIGTGEKKERASMYPNNDWAFIWAGANEGDLLYNADYKLYTQKVGSKKVSSTSYKYNDYTYNATRKMIYSYPSKHKGQPDLLLVASTEASCCESADVYYMHKGKLKKVKDGMGYTLRPQMIGKNQFKIANYYNIEGYWYVNTATFNPAKGTFKYSKAKKYYYTDFSTKTWKKHWK